MSAPTNFQDDDPNQSPGELIAMIGFDDDASAQAMVDHLQSHLPEGVDLGRGLTMDSGGILLATEPPRIYFLDPAADTVTVSRNSTEPGGPLHVTVWQHRNLIRVEPSEVVPE